MTHVPRGVRNMLNAYREEQLAQHPQAIVKRRLGIDHAPPVFVAWASNKPYLPPDDVWWPNGWYGFRRET